MTRFLFCLTLAIALLLAVPLAAAPDDKAEQTWSGTLVDADCKARDPGGPCEVSSSTASFGIVTGDGMFAKFDGQGNSLAASQLRGKSGRVKVKVTGKLSGDTIEVQQIQVVS